jgi:hypothetical protein
MLELHIGGIRKDLEDFTKDIKRIADHLDGIKPKVQERIMRMQSQPQMR